MKKTVRRFLVPTLAAALGLAASFTVLAAENVKVTVPNVKGGFLQVSYWNDEDVCTYLPVGEVTEVPKGTKLRIWPQELSYRTGTSRITAEVESVTANGEEVDFGYFRYGDVTADEDTVLNAVFLGEERKIEIGTGGDYELVFQRPDGQTAGTMTGIFEPGKLPEQQLCIYDYDSQKNLGLSGVEEIEIEDVYYYSSATEEYEECDGIFSVSDVGKLRASESLKKGTYDISGRYVYKGEKQDFYLQVRVGAGVEVSLPFVKYKSNTESQGMSIRPLGYVSIDVPNLNSDTYGTILNQWRQNKERIVLAGYEIADIGLNNYRTGQFTSLKNTKINTRIKDVYDLLDYVSLQAKGYKIPTVEPLDASAIIPADLKPGWVEISGKWYYYSSVDPIEIVKNEWREENGKEFWLGADGAMVVNGLAGTGDEIYLVNEKGEKTDFTGTKVVDGMDCTFENGLLTEKKIHLETPSNADKNTEEFKESISDMADLILEDKVPMTEEEIIKAADMIAEALGKLSNDAITAEEAQKYDAVFEKAFAGRYLLMEPSISMGEGASIDAADQLGEVTITGGLAAAGITSKDFGEDPVTIEYVVEQLATSSNASQALRFEVKLLVNGKAVDRLSTPIFVTIAMPDSFVASYSNASYNYKVSHNGKTETADLSDDGGRLTLTVNDLGIYAVTMTKKGTGSTSGRKPTPAGSGGSGGSGGSYTNTATKMKGTWVLNDVGWWFRYDDGTWPAAQWVELEWQGVVSWYYFNADGYMATGWKQDGGHTYYLHPVADGTRGYMYTGWHQINNSWYYFSTVTGGPKGSMAVNTTTPDGYAVGADGVWIP